MVFEGFAAVPSNTADLIEDGSASGDRRANSGHRNGLAFGKADFAQEGNANGTKENHLRRQALSAAA